jgi:hypothetical protein
MYAELKLHSLTSPTLHPPSLRMALHITSDIIDIASTDTTATSTQRLCCITNNASTSTTPHLTLPPLIYH